ncbi:hypothetical protein CJ179_38740 [Rhodococcus sp. ACS1]|uniref:hypothetical protein n=1 Tax=Rhodococcus sp. ACS1 TaxID=2028570 RepID=UPI000BB160FC|nr:hypothetical protein [Rhodococcus sp. ACS1]PBC38539.1 hypothetical protein CJ179_38740 [Rhodococcus sp. ACS1]
MSSLLYLFIAITWAVYTGHKSIKNARKAKGGNLSDREVRTRATLALGLGFLWPIMIPWSLIIYFALKGKK